MLGLSLSCYLCSMFLLFKGSSASAEICSIQSEWQAQD
jgi:hypothetical protein